MESPIFFQQRIARLQSLLEASRKVHGSIDLDKIVPEVLMILVKELELQGAALVPDREAAGMQRFEYGRVPPCFSDGSDVPEGVPRFALRSQAGEPQAELLLALQDGRELDAEEANFVEGLTLQAAVAVENALSHENRLRWERLRRDMETARAIQHSLQPQEMPRIPGYEIQARCEECLDVGGDYLDILGLPDGDVFLAVADVAGKGLSSALVGTSFRASLRAMLKAGTNLQEVGARINDLHFEEGEEARRKYVTAFFMILRPGRHEVEILNAGHNHGILCVEGGGHRLVKSSGPPLGMLPGRSYRKEIYPLPPGAVLMAYTDGLTEAMRNEEEYGPERLAEELEKKRGRPAKDLLDGIWDAVLEWEDGSGPPDDKTGLIMRRLPE